MSFLKGRNLAPSSKSSKKNGSTQFHPVPPNKRVPAFLKILFDLSIKVVQLIDRESLLIHRK